MFKTDKNTGSNDLIDKLMNTITGSGGGSSVLELSDIEKRQQDLDHKLYELANKHRKAYSKATGDN